MMWQNAARLAAAAPRFVRVRRWIRMSERRSTWWVSASNDSSSLATVDWCCAETAVKREREAMKGREREERGREERERSEEGNVRKEDRVLVRERLGEGQRD
jgi:hypothetical protein